MILKYTMAITLLLCAIWCFSSALTIDDMLYVKVDNDLDNGILQTGEESMSDCQAKDFTKWDKLFTMLENSQMRENMLLQTIDDVIKVELQSVRGEMLQFVRNFAGACTTNIERATSKITEQLERSLDSKFDQAQQQESGLEAQKENILQESLFLSFNISNRLDEIEKALKRKTEGEAEAKALQQNQVKADCAAQGASLDAALQQIQDLALKLQSTQEWANQRLLPSGCDAAILFPMRSPKIYASVHPAEMTLEAFTSCVWVKVTEALDRTIVFSYGTKRNPYEIQVYLNQNSAALVVGGDKNKVIADNVVEPGQWSQLCSTWSSEEGNATLWANGEQVATSYEVAKGHTIPGRGIFQLGQEKNGCCVGGGFDESLSFSGKLTGFNLWDRVLDDEEIARTGGPDACNIRGNIVGWGTTEILTHGGAQYIY
ncbi:pentraxin-related protein PTX3 [Discoglossus pictus]